MISPALQDEMNRRAMYARVSSAKWCAREYLRDEFKIMTIYGFRVLDRWLRRYARKHPMGKYIHGSTFEEPSRGDHD